MGKPKVNITLPPREQLHNREFVAKGKAGHVYRILVDKGQITIVRKNWKYPVSYFELPFLIETFVENGPISTPDKPGLKIKDKTHRTTPKVFEAVK